MDDYFSAARGGYGKNAPPLPADHLPPLLVGLAQPSMTRMRAIGTVAMAWAIMSSAWGQMAPDPSLGKPVPKEGEVSAVKGETMSIQLVSEAKTRASVVEFLIRDFPLNGELGPMISLEEDRTKAIIKYTAYPDTAATTDSFSYAVRYPGGLWSQKVEVKISLEASEPKIHATTELDFGKVMLGQSAEGEIFLSNSGTAPYRNQIQLPAPWSLVEPANGLLNLPVGAQQTVRVRYTPVIAGNAEHRIAFFRNQGATTRLIGAGYEPFSVSVPELSLRWEEKSRTRLGTLTITSHAPTRLPVTLSTDERLRVSGGGALYVMPDESATFQIYLSTEDVEPYAGQIQIATGDFTIPVSISAPVAPAYLVVENTGTDERKIDFGPIEPGGLAQGSFQLRNVGGTEVKARLSTRPPFSVLAAGGLATLDPLEAEAFAVRVAAPDGIFGPYESELLIEGENGQVLRVVLRATFLGSNEELDAAVRLRASTPMGSPSDQPPTGTNPTPGADRPLQSQPRLSREEEDRIIAEMDKLRSPLGFITFPTVERQTSPSIPPVSGEKIHLIEDGRRHLTVGWPLPSIGHDQFELEMRMMRQTDEAAILESVWIPYHDVAYTPDATGEISAEIRGLAPNHNYEFRVFTLGDDGKVSEPLAFTAKTRMPFDWTWIYIGFGIVVAAAILGLIWWRLRASAAPKVRFPGFSDARDMIRGVD